MMETVVAIFLALVAVAILGALTLETLDVMPEWLAVRRHALAEAWDRAGGVLAEFGDWLRLGR